MKRLNNLRNIFLILSAIFAWGCGDDAKNNAIEDRVAYIKDAYMKKYAELYIEDDAPTNMVIPVGVTHIDEGKEIKMSLDFSSEVLDAYNKKYNKNYILYPADKRKFLSKEVIIKKGAASASAQMEISPFSEDLRATGDTYAIPVTISQVDGAGIMKGSESFIYVLRQIPIATTGSVRNGTGYIRFPMPQQEYFEFTAFTAEFMFNISTFSARDNHVMFYNNVTNSTNKNDGQLFTRLENGSKGVENTSFEFSIGDNVSIQGTPNGGKFEVGKWYHIACVYANRKIYLYINGNLAAKKDVARTSFKLHTEVATKWAGFSFGGGNIGLTKVAEVRLWNIERTQDQIKENMYQINPSTEGLLGYWKINEGSGYEFNDATGNSSEKAYTDTKAAPVWYLDQRLNVE
ncbi:MAG: DUF1735 and LamG domain-containing protein [Dysgonomonas sp.]|nr:DUF1735 and LamG domain-containing protein [Dysgonomonas sp.]